MSSKENEKSVESFDKKNSWRKLTWKTEKKKG
jgi:hypothetical protein